MPRKKVRKTKAEIAEINAKKDEYRAQWREENRELDNEYKRRWWDENKDRVNAERRKKRRKKALRKVSKRKKP